MGSDYHFTKFHVADHDQTAALDELLLFVDDRCSRNGLQPVDDANHAHFVMLAILGAPGWIHFSSKGHYLPLNTLDYQPVVPDLSHWRSSVTCWVRGSDSYVLRRYDGGELSAKYANLNSGNRFESQAAAEGWLPVYEDWMDLLTTSSTPDKFYQLLPGPVTVDSPTPTWQPQPANLPTSFATLFGWNKDLDRATVNHPVKDGPGYRSKAGTYTDGSARSIVRCYAHPKLPEQYNPHWDW